MMSGNPRGTRKGAATQPSVSAGTGLKLGELEAYLLLSRRLRNRLSFHTPN